MTESESAKADVGPALAGAREPRWLRARQVELLYDQSAVALAATTVAGAVLVAMLWQASSPAVLCAWLLALGVVNAARYLLARRYRDAPARSKDEDRWLAPFLAGVLASGLTWGATVIVLVPPGEYLYAGLAVLWNCGLAAGSVAALSAVPSAYASFAVPALLPGSLYLLAQGHHTAIITGSAQLLFLGFISLNAMRTHQSTKHALELREQNARLVVSLAAEKERIERLNEQLEERVATRTAELAEANARLEDDILARERIERALFAEKERALVTLHSIGDAVIATDAEGRIEFLNPVAESLTGWSQEHARGLPLGRVFSVVHEHSREPIPDPVAEVLAHNRPVRIPAQAVLIGRHGQEHAVQDSVAPIRGDDGSVLGAVLVFSDVTAAREMAMRLTHQATHDSLTGLVNRREFEVRLQRVLETAHAERSEHALCYVDLDQFKVINDTCGHVAGDELLRQLATDLRVVIRHRDTFARLGGDEFGILMEHCSPDVAERAARSLLERVKAFRLTWGGQTFSVGASIGLVPVTADSEGATAVLGAADAACYVAKDAGGNDVHVYREDDAAMVRRHGEMRWVTQLQRAVREGHLMLYEQAIVPLAAADGPVRQRREVLLRLQTEQGDIIEPSEFLPAAERYHFAVEIDRWVIENTFRVAASTAPHVMSFINLSGQSVGNPGVLEFVLAQLDATGVDADSICFEITETAAVANFSRAAEFMARLKSRGCQFALDDFGSGVSSFGYLKQLDVDYLKIDGSFVRGALVDRFDLAVVQSINELGKMMGRSVIAECIEDAPTRDALSDLGVDFGQGIAIEAPGPMPGFERQHLARG